MTPVNLTSALVVGVLFTAGTYLLLQRSLMRVIIGIVMLGHGTNLLLLLVGGDSGRPPMAGSADPDTMSDPLPQAMALTSIVITFALSTFLLALSYRAWTLLGDDEVQDDVEDSRIGHVEPHPFDDAPDAPEPPDDGSDAPDDSSDPPTASEPPEGTGTGARP